MKTTKEKKEGFEVFVGSTLARYKAEFRYLFFLFLNSAFFPLFSCVLFFFFSSVQRNLKVTVKRRSRQFQEVAFAIAVLSSHCSSFCFACLKKKGNFSSSLYFLLSIFFSLLLLFYAPVKLQYFIGYFSLFVIPFSFFLLLNLWYFWFYPFANLLFFLISPLLFPLSFISLWRIIFFFFAPFFSCKN